MVVLDDSRRVLGADLVVARVHVRLRERVVEWTRQWKEEGRVELTHELVARKFDRATADRFKERLEKVGDSHQTVKVGIWILECESAEELLSRLERVSVPAPTDGNAATL